MSFALLFKNQIYLLGVVSALILGAVIKQKGYYQQIHSYFSSKLNNRWVFGLMAMFGGILPLEGRCVVSAPLLDGFTQKKDQCGCCGNNESRKKYGLIDYVSTHHYYLWSPLEPAVLIVMAGLGLTYTQFLSITALPLLVYFLFLFGLIRYFLKDQDLEFHPDQLPSKDKPTEALVVFSAMILTILGIAVSGALYGEKGIIQVWTAFPVLTLAVLLFTKTSIKDAWRAIDWRVIAFVALLIALGNVVKSYSKELETFLKAMEASLVPLLLTGMGFAFLLGSSSKYAGITVVIAKITSVKFLPLILMFEYVGYLLSPAHKCLGISKAYFKSSWSLMYLSLLALSLLMLASGFVTYVAFM